METNRILEIIRSEIERRITDNTFGAKLELIDILAWLDTLESENPMQNGLDVTDFCKPIDPGIAQCIADHSWEMLGEEKSEKPMNQDELEKAVVDYFEGYWPGMETAEQCNTDLHFTPPAIMRLVKHFYELGHSEKPNSHLEGLDEAAEKYAHCPFTDDDGNFHEDAVDASEFNAFKAGAKWQKEQDLAEMAQSRSPLSVAYANRCFENGKQAMKEQMMKEAVEVTVENWNQEPHPEISIPLNPEEYSNGDKVRILLIKEDK